MKDPIYLKAHASQQQYVPAPTSPGPGVYTTQKLVLDVIDQLSHAGSFANSEFTVPRDARLLVTVNASSIEDGDDVRLPVSILAYKNSWEKLAFAPNNLGQPVTAQIDVVKGDKLFFGVQVKHDTAITPDPVSTNLSITELLQ